jgi:hypothetical protein
LQRDLPPIGSEVITNKGRARVLAQEILAGQVLIETEDMRRIVIDAADVLTVLSRGSRRKQDEATVSGSEAIIDERDVALSTLEDEPAIDEAVSRAVDATDETWDSFDANGDGDNGIAQST